MSLMGKRKVPAMISSGGASSRIMPSRAHYRSHSRAKHPQVEQPTEDKRLVFKLEPLIKTNAASVELSAQAILNRVRAGILNSHISREAAYRVPVAPRPEDRPLPDCPRVPPALKGKLNVTKKERLGNVRRGGWWTPRNCSSRHAVAVVVPFRDRHRQLDTLMSHLHPVLQRQQISYRIFLVEQEGNDTFNKGVLMNAGFMTALRTPVRPGTGVVYHCFVFHDVDMLTEDDRNLYTCPQQPRHLSVAVNELDYKLPYRELVGGVFAIRTDHFLRVNGYSNLYWGWGGEDDDMGYRVEHVLYTISRPPEWIARYSMIKHEKRRPLAWKVRTKLTRTWRRYKYDGLNTLQYRLLAYRELPLYTRLLVDVGHPPNNIRLLQEEEEKMRKPKETKQQG